MTPLHPNRVWGDLESGLSVVELRDGLCVANEVSSCRSPGRRGCVATVVSEEELPHPVGTARQKETLFCRSRTVVTKRGNGSNSAFPSE